MGVVDPPIRSSSREKSTPTAEWPAATMARICRPFPQPTSRTCDDSGSPSKNWKTAGHGLRRVAAKGRAMRWYAPRISAFVGMVPARDPRRAG